MRKLKVLDLFSGIGGFSLGLERTGGFETVAFCEIEAFPRKVLAKHWPDVPCFEDVRELKGSDVGSIDLICGGYPCQPFSTAGRRQGKEDDRHLWPEFMRLVDELRPAWVIGENVAGHISLGLDDVLSDLEGQGYACRTFVIPACAVDAKHRRDRVWTVAYAQHSGFSVGWRAADAGEERNGRNRIPTDEPTCGREQAQQVLAYAQGERCGEARRDSERPTKRVACSGIVAHAGGSRLSNPTRKQQRSVSEAEGTLSRRKPSRTASTQWAAWPVEPDVGRVAHGVPNRVDRLRALGNAVVPQIPEIIGHAILAAEQAVTS